MPTYGNITPKPKWKLTWVYENRPDDNTLYRASEPMLERMAFGCLDREPQLVKIIAVSTDGSATIEFPARAKTETEMDASDG